MTTIPWLGTVRYPIGAARYAFDITLGKMFQASPSRSSDVEVPYFKSVSVQWNGIQANQEIRMWAAPSEFRDLVVRTGDLLICEGGDVGRAAIYDGPDGFIFEKSVHRARPLNGSDTRYLWYVLRALHGSDWLDVLCNKATIRHLTGEKLGGLEIPLPPQEEQRRIADFLDAETARIERLTSTRSLQSKLLDDRRRSQLSELVGSLAQRFGSIRLRHMLMRIEQGWSPQCEDRLAERGEWGVVKAGCVNSGRFDPSQHKALPAGVEPRREYVLKQGDLLMSRASGSTELIGSVGVVRELSDNLLLCDKVYRIRLDRTRAQAEFVAHVLRCHQAREHIKNGISGAEGMANNLPTSIVKDLLLPNVPVSKQASISDSLHRSADSVARARKTLHHSIQTLTERRQALITAAVTGQFDVSTASGRGVTDGVQP
jgi:type I restriction enzyme, S subunit